MTHAGARAIVALWEIYEGEQDIEEAILVLGSSNGVVPRVGEAYIETIVNTALGALALR